MVTLLVYLVIAFVLTFTAVRLWMAQKKNPNFLAFYFMMGIAVLALGQVLNLLLIIFYLASGVAPLLYWADILGRFASYASTIFFVQVPLYLLFPKFKYRLWVSYILGILGLVFLAIYLLNPYQPVVNSLGIINWATPTSLSLQTGIVMLLVWLTTTVVFFYEYFKSKFRSIKSLVMGVGFLLGSVGAVLQDYGQTQLEYVLINLILVLAFILIFIGVYIKES